MKYRFLDDSKQPLTGSDSLLWIDGRLKVANKVNIANKQAEKLRAIKKFEPMYIQEYEPHSHKRDIIML